MKDRGEGGHSFVSVSLANGEQAQFESIAADKAVLDREYDAWKSKAEAAKISGSAGEYVDAVNGLLGLMTSQLLFDHGDMYGDLHHSLVNWSDDARREFLNNQENRDRLKTGVVTWRTNTLNNQMIPHPSDVTSIEVSRMMAEAVVRFVGGRGGDYVEAAVVRGERMTSPHGYDVGPGSPSQVLTTVKGFEAVRPNVVLKTFDVDWAKVKMK